MEKIYSPKEEKLNILTHAFGTVLALAGSITLMIRVAGYANLKMNLAFLVYCIGLTTMFLASTLYHSATDSTTRGKLKIFDHTAIFLSIAGTYTPITLITMPPGWGIPVLVCVWIMSAAGILMKFFLIGRNSKLSTIIYVLLGWTIVVALKPLVESMSLSGLAWLLAGGLFYTVGAVLYQFKKLKYNHAIFHFFVLGGAFCHYVVVYAYCLPGK